jgi:hypothetical protein
MNLKEKCLYHQIHPLKLFTDIGAAFGSLYLLWRHRNGCHGARRMASIALDYRRRKRTSSIWLASRENQQRLTMR